MKYFVLAQKRIAQLCVCDGEMEIFQYFFRHDRRGKVGKSKIAFLGKVRYAK